MGLDFRILRTEPIEERPSWAYSGFNTFRRRLSDAEGFNLDHMMGFGGNDEWGNIKTPLKPLLNHSDCDGTLSYYECQPMIARLREICETWPEDDYDRIMGLRLADAMADLVEGDKLEFC